MPHQHLGRAEALTRWPGLVVGAQPLRQCASCKKDLKSDAFSQSQNRKRSKNQRRCRECIDASRQQRSPKRPKNAMGFMPSSVICTLNLLPAHALVGLLHDVIVNFPRCGARSHKQYLALFTGIMNNKHLKLASVGTDNKSKAVQEALKNTLQDASFSRRELYSGSAAGLVLALSGSAQAVEQFAACGAKNLIDEKSIFTAVRLGHLDCFQKMAKVRPDWPFMCWQNWGPVLTATYFGHGQILKAMAEMGAAEKINQDARLCFAIALGQGDMDCASALLDIVGKAPLDFEFVQQAFYHDLLGIPLIKPTVWILPFCEHPQSWQFLVDTGVASKLCSSSSPDSGDTLAHLCAHYCNPALYAESLKLIHQTLKTDPDIQAVLNLPLQDTTSFSAEVRGIRQKMEEAIALRVRNYKGQTPASLILVNEYSYTFPMDRCKVYDLLADIGGLSGLWHDLGIDPSPLSRGAHVHSELLASPSRLDLASKQAWLSWYLKRMTAAPDTDFHFTIHWSSPLHGACEALGIDQETGAQALPRDLLLRHVDHADEEGAAGDGLRREWLCRAVAELMNPQHGLFVTAADGSTLLPNPDANVLLPDHVAQMTLLGRICGLLLYHKETTPTLSFICPAFIKLAVKIDLNEQDLATLDPETYERVVRYLQNDRYADEKISLEDLSLTFTCTDEPRPEYTCEADHPRVEWELVHDGANKTVDESNKEEFIHLQVQHRLRRWRERVAAQVAAFISGIDVFITDEIAGILSRCCTPTELILMLGGAPEIGKAAFDDWQQHTRYIGGLSAESTLSSWFWEVVKSFGQENLARLLAFVTGSPRPPASGFARLSGFNGAETLFTLQAVDGDDSRLPSAQTCFNTLRIPSSYKSKEMLQARLQLAIRNYVGFSEEAVAN